MLSDKPIHVIRYGVNWKERLQMGEGTSSNLVVLTNGFRLKLLGKYGRLGFEPQHLHKSNFIIWG